jgi:hypothetical protein
MLVDEVIAEHLLTGSFQFLRVGRSRYIPNEVARRLRSPEGGANLDIPPHGLKRVRLDLLPNLVSYCSSFVRNLVRCQRTLTSAQVRPALLDFGQLQCMEPPCLARVSGTQAKALFTLPEKVAKVIRNTFPEPIIAAVGMLPGTSH